MPEPEPETVLLVDYEDSVLEHGYHALSHTNHYRRAEAKAVPKALWDAFEAAEQAAHFLKCQIAAYFRPGHKHENQS